MLRQTEITFFLYWLGCNFSRAFGMSPLTFSNKRVNHPPPLLNPIEVIVIMASLIFGSEMNEIEMLR